MLLTPLVFIAAIILEVLGSYMSVVGLSSKSSVVLVILAIALDFSKVVVASIIYKNWKDLNFLFKSFLLPTTLFLMVITSYGAYAYLLQEFGKTTSNQEQISAKLTALEEESKKLNARKKEIDSQIADVSPVFVTQKKRLTEMFAKELEYLNSRTIELDREIPVVRASLMTDTLQAGTLGSLAKSWGTTPDQTAKLIALMMVIVIDPLAIVMLMVGNFLQIKRQKDLEIAEQRKEQKQLEKEKRDYELRKLKIEAHAHEHDEPKESTKEVAKETKKEIKRPEKKVEKVEKVQKVEEKIEKIEPIVQSVEQNVEIYKVNDFIPPIVDEVKQQEEIRVNTEATMKSKKEEKKNSWEASAPAVLKKKVQTITQEEDDPFHSGSSIDDMLNSLDDIDPNVLNKIKPTEEK